MTSDPTPVARQIDDLRSIVGEAGLLTDPELRLGYETPARYEAGRCAAVVRPVTAHQVATVLAYAAAEGLRLVPQSGNTGLVLGSTPDGAGDQIVLSLDRLDAVRAITPLDRSVRAQAGVRLSQLNLALEPHGLFLPIDLGADPMLGGMVATNAGGARFLRYGDMRRQVLALEVALPDGRVVELGSGLRKDNTRLDLRDLFVGSCGALGVVTGATLQVHPRPRQTAAALVVPATPEASLEILQDLEQSAPEFLSAFEAMSGAAMRAALAHLPSLRNPFGEPPPAYALLVEFACGVPEGLLSLEDLLAETLAPLLEAGLASDIRLGPPGHSWALRHGLSEGLRARGYVVGLDLAFRRDRVFAFRAAAAHLLSRGFAEFALCDFGHVADGGVHLNLVAERGTGADRVQAVRTALTALAVDEFGGSFSGEHGLGRMNQASYDAHVPHWERALAGQVAALFAPQGLGDVRFGLSDPGVM